MKALNFLTKRLNNLKEKIIKEKEDCISSRIEAKKEEEFLKIVEKSIMEKERFIFLMKKLKRRKMMEDNRIYKTGVKNFDDLVSSENAVTSTQPLDMKGQENKKEEEKKYRESGMEDLDDTLNRHMAGFEKTPSQIVSFSEKPEETLGNKLDELGKEYRLSKMINNFDRIGDWEKFNQHMTSYLEIPNAKYSGMNAFNDLLHYTGLRVMCWHLLKYSLRVWLGYGKRHDFEKIAHYAQMAWSRARAEDREAPFFEEDESQKKEFIIKN